MASPKRSGHNKIRKCKPKQCIDIVRSDTAMSRFVENHATRGVFYTVVLNIVECPQDKKKIYINTLISLGS